MARREVRLPAGGEQSIVLSGPIRRWTIVALPILLVVAVAGGVFAATAGPTGMTGSRAAASGTARRAVVGTPPGAGSAEGRPSPSPAAVRIPTPIPGYLLIADRGNDRMLLVDSAGRVLWRYPPSGRSPSFPFSFDDDTFFGDSFRQIISQQEEQQTIQTISFPGGRVLWHYGVPNVRGSSSGYLSTPDDAYLLPNGVRTVADVRNCRILFISPAGRVIRQLGTTGVCAHDPPTSFASPNGDTPIPGGGTLVTEISGSWVDAIGPDGKLRWSIHVPVAYPSDAQWLGGGRILLADYSNPGHVLMMNTGGRVLWSYGYAQSGEAALNHPSLAILLPNGLIAVNDDYRDRVVLIDPATHRIVWQYGHTDQAGTGPGFLNTPDGMDLLPFQAAMADPSIRAVVTPRR